MKVQYSKAEAQSVKTFLKTIGIVMILMGTIWFLQGINILPGSFMTGQIRWAVYGSGTAVIGVALVVAAKARRRQK